MKIGTKLLFASLTVAFFVHCGPAAGAESRRAATFYVAHISSEEGWEDVMVNPVGADYIGAYLAVAALSTGYARYRNGALELEAEGQIAYNFGGQHHWEFNVVPVIARWRQPFAPSERIETSVAFGLGLSYATQVPPIEVDLEGESRAWLIYWVAEVTAGPPHGRWAVTARLHHRSVGYGLMGDEGGMNALGLGVRYRF